MRFIDYLKESLSSIGLTFIKNDIMSYYLMDLSKDSFIHFTSKSNIKSIEEVNGLLLDPPQGHFGPKGVFAISTITGEYVPQVQKTHLSKNDDDIIAIHFTTDVPPTYGSRYKEEVIWSNFHGLNDLLVRKQPIKIVPFRQFKILTVEEAIKKIPKTSPQEEYDIFYDPYIINTILKNANEQK